MAKIVISPIKGGFNLSMINAAFAEIVRQLNELVLYRNSPAGEPNQVMTDIDLNNKRIYNVPPPTEDGDIVRWKEVKTVLEFNPELYATEGELAALTARVQALEAAVFPPP